MSGLDGFSLAQWCVDRQVRMGVVMRDVDWQAGIGVVK